MKGYVQVYTGNGKGKTTAALGLALRAAGAGLRVYIAQFVKGMPYSEHKALERLADRISIRQFGRSCFIRKDPEEEDYRAARAGLLEVQKILASGEYDLVILDEANVATTYRLFSAEELLAMVEARPEHVEVVITGRSADPKILERADLVTEMAEVRHYYTRGVEARPGIET